MPHRSHTRREPGNRSTPSAILVAVQSPELSDEALQRSLDELEQLTLGLGHSVLQRFVQKRSTGGPTFLGEGKLRELAVLTGGPGEVRRGPAASTGGSRNEDLLVIIDDELTPGQIHNLEQALNVEVLDRTGIILRVFEGRARTREAMLEIELARLEYELPRIREDRSLSDREGGGGRASRGHTNVQLAKQRARARMAELRRELESVQAGADRIRLSRAETFRVALVGYTNAGKSSVMRLLTGSEVLVEDKLFATLGTSVRQLSPPTCPPILLTDTVGFIHRLPHSLLASFRSTLAEAREASLLLNVVDASDPAFPSHLSVTTELLNQIGAGATPTSLLLNKADRLSAVKREALAHEYPDALLVSALSPADGGALRKRVVTFFASHLVEATFSIPWDRQGVLAEVRPLLQVVHEDYGSELTVTVRGTASLLRRLEARLSAK